MADKRYTVIAPDGTVGTVPESEYASAVASGFRPENDAEYESRKKQETYGDSAADVAIATGLGALRGATFGISDLVGKNLYNDPAAGAKELGSFREENPIASTTGEVGGALATSLIPGSPVALAAKAGGSAERLAAGIIGTRASGIGRALASGISKGAGSSIEGAIYGGGVAVTEDALGNDPDLNAEKILADIGKGALLGGLGGSVLGTLSTGVGEVGSKAAGLLKGKTVSEKAANWLENFASDERFRAGFGQNKRAFVQLNRRDMMDRADVALKDIIKGGAKTQEEITEALMVKRDALRNQNHEMLAKLDKAVEDLGNEPVISAADIAERIKKDLIAPIENSPAQRDVVAYLRDEAQEIKRSSFPKPPPGIVVPEEELAKLPPRKLTFAEASKERAAQQARVNYNVDAKPMQEAKNDIARLWNELIDEKASPIAKGIGLDESAYKTIRREQSLYEEMSKHAESRMLGNQSVRTVSPSDYIAGTAGAVTGAIHSPLTSLVTGPAMAFGNKIARTYGPSYLSRASDYLAGLLRADKAVRSTNSKIDSAVKGLLSAKERIPTITAGQIAKEDSEEANKKSMDILEKLADQSVASNHVGNIGAQFDLGAPMTATAVRLKSAKAIKFLHEKMPKAPVFKSLQPNLESKKWKVTSLERARFNRYVRAVTDPMSVLDEMRRGIVNIEGIETLRSIYPALHADLSNKLISASAEKREELPYKTRVALGALIGAVTDTTLNPRFTATMMDIRSDDAASSEERASGGVRPTAGAMSKMKFAEQAKTNVEKRLG